MRIVALDTSNQPMSVALWGEQGLIVEKTTTIKRNHSVQLMPAIDELMQEAGWKVSDLDRVAVAKGPGSYTGVRIGVTVAKTLAWAGDLELVGVSSLKALAGNGMRKEGHLISPIFDARRENIYTGLYQVDKDLNLKQIEEDTHISAREWAEFLATKNQKIEVIGKDYSKFEEVFESALGENLLRSSNSNQVPKAGTLAEIALNEKPVDIHTFAPEYTKLAEAEEKWKEAHPHHKGGGFVEKI